MDFRSRGASAEPSPAWLDYVSKAATKAGIDYEPVPLVGWMRGRDLLAAVRHLGGSATPIGRVRAWTLDPWDVRPNDRITELTPDLTGQRLFVDDFIGSFRIDLDGESYVAIRTDQQLHPRFVDRLLILGAQSLGSAHALADRLKQAKQELEHGEINVFGSEQGSLVIDPICEKDLILESRFKSDLLHYARTPRPRASRPRPAGPRPPSRAVAGGRLAFLTEHVSCRATRSMFTP